MRYLLNIIFNLLFVVSCASAQYRYGKEFGNYVDDFEKNCNKTVLLPIKFASMPKDTLARCVGFNMPWLFRRIEINPDYWKKANYYQRESTMLHELGHCVLDLEHDNTMIGEYYVFKRPRTLMFPYEFSAYNVYRNEYRDRFFNQCKL